MRKLAFEVENEVIFASAKKLRRNVEYVGFFWVNYFGFDIFRMDY